MQLSTTQRTNRLSNLTSNIGTSARLKIYTGSAPGIANSATGTLLSTINLPSPAWTVSSGVATLAGTWQDTSAAASGTPGYFRITDSAGTTIYLEGTAAVSSGELSFTATISLGGTVTVTAFTLTEGNA
jgi:hypothetical protein